MGNEVSNILSFNNFFEKSNIFGENGEKNSAVCVRTLMVNVNTFSATVKDEISEGR